MKDRVPLAPLYVCSTDPLPHLSINDTPIVYGNESYNVDQPLGVKIFCAKLAFSVVQLDELVKQCAASKSQDNDDVVAVELLNLLGFQDGKVLDNNQFYIAFFHVGAVEKGNGSEQNADVEYVDALVSGIMRQAQPGSDIGSRLHLSLVMSYGSLGG